MNSIQEVKLVNIAIVERAIKGKIYKMGSVFFPLSAIGDCSIVSMLTVDGEIETRYAVAFPTVECIPIYFHIAIEQAFPLFASKYATTINIQKETLKEFRLLWHFDLNEQAKVVECFSVLNKEIEILEEQIRMEKRAKKAYLSHLFP